MENGKFTSNMMIEDAKQKSKDMLKYNVHKTICYNWAWKKGSEQEREKFVSAR